MAACSMHHGAPPATRYSRSSHSQYLLQRQPDSAAHTVGCVQLTEGCFPLNTSAAWLDGHWKRWASEGVNFVVNGLRLGACTAATADQGKVILSRNGDSGQESRSRRVGDRLSAKVSVF